MDGPEFSLSKSEDSEGNVERDPGEVLLRPVATNLTSARAKLVLGLHWPPASLAPSCRPGGAEVAGVAHAGGEGGDACDRARCRPRNRDHSDLMLPSLARARRGLASRTRKKSEPQEPGWRRPQLPAGERDQPRTLSGSVGGKAPQPPPQHRARKFYARRLRRTARRRRQGTEAFRARPPLARVLPLAAAPCRAMCVSRCCSL